jgi:DNA ligase (NAD+)
MNFQDAEKKYTELKAELIYHSNRYYNDDAPEISDYEYDMKMRELKAIEDEYPELISPDSPTRKVGGNASEKFSPVPHKVQMESLQDAFSFDEIEAFINRVKTEIPDAQFVVEPKIDGLSVSLEYENDVFVRGSTRGDGFVGEDITENLLNVKSVPKRIKTGLPFLEVRGEVYMSRESFAKLRQYQEENDEKLAKNPRNAAAGSLRQKNAEITKQRDLDIFVFNVQQAEGKDFENHSDSLDFLRDAGFSVIPFYNIFSTKEEILKELERIGEIRLSLSFDTDGAVIKLNSIEGRKILGATAKFPKWAIAYKYPPEEKETTLLDIEIAVGRTGKITPTGIFNPVELAGTTVTRAVLHNEDFIREKGLMIGDRVILRKAGEIIPELVKVVAHTEQSRDFNFPEYCPSCGEKTVRLEGESAHRCINTECPAQLYRNLIHFVSRDAMDIEGLGPAIIEDFIENGFLKSPTDLYSITKENIASLEGMGDKSADNILLALNESKSRDLYRFIYALGIKNIGEKAAKILANKFGSIDALMSATTDDILSLDGFGDTMAESIVDYFSLDKTKSLIEKFKEIGINMVQEIEEIEDKRFENLTFVLTGTLSKYKRSEAAAIIESFAGKVSGSVSKKTDYVLAGEDAGSKLIKAQSLGIKIISETEFENMCK